MNKTVPSPTNWPEEKRKSKRGGIRAIDKGTPYDVPGRLKKWAREIESGKLGRATDFLMVVRVVRDDGVAYEHFSNGISTIETYAYMADLAKKRWMPG